MKKVLIIDNVLFFNESSEVSISDYLKMPVRLISSDDLFSNLEKATNELIESNKEGNGYSFLVVNPIEYHSVYDGHGNDYLNHLLDFLQDVAKPNGIEVVIFYYDIMTKKVFNNLDFVLKEHYDVAIKKNNFLDNLKNAIQQYTN